MLLSTPLGWRFLIPSGLWMHRNERLRRRWASRFLLFPRNQVEEVKKCCKHKKLWVEHLPCSGGAETNLWLHLKRKKKIKKESCRTHLEKVKSLLPEQILASAGAQQPWLLPVALANSRELEQPFPSTRKSREELSEDASTAEILSWRVLLNTFS